MKHNKTFFRTPLLALALACTVPLAQAQATFPTKPIIMVIPFAPGGTSDLVARIMATKVSAILKQSVIVENRSGADGILGASSVAKAPPDGHTLLQISTTHVILPSLRKDLPYDLKRDLVPVYGQMGVPQLVVVNATSKVQNMKDLTALAKSRTGGLNYASGGTGTLGQLTSQMVYQEMGAPANHIPYRGLAPAMQALMGDQVDTAALNLSETLPVIQGGKLRALAITSAQRSPDLPDVPTLKELGFPEPVLTSWTAILAPAGTPDSAIKILNDAYAKAVADPEVAQRFRQLGVENHSLSAAELQTFLNAEEARWRNVFAKQGVRQ
ncbi:tripartite tricarboxylate transporter substrate binding protein [Hydrogenophaga sp.]|uniref:Bug family tripartite tricarboxylate transporter substrate binding protein n=1 Tax=Hydrogenophaga sp. TaxID=1904254 RepID=UPI00271AAECD|nr:tripartite tricarboxylate transporter substrate binding protein [Hydrogenophaga sp.]MDO9437237.1 tripartite tricarboxylate transporter substrate binding protein [Hydrogenophaga sp.]